MRPICLPVRFDCIKKLSRRYKERYDFVNKYMDCELAAEARNIRMVEVEGYYQKTVATQRLMDRIDKALAHGKVCIYDFFDPHQLLMIASIRMSDGDFLTTEEANKTVRAKRLKSELGRYSKLIIGLYEQLQKESTVPAWLQSFDILDEAEGVINAYLDKTDERTEETKISN